MTEWRLIAEQLAVALQHSTPHDAPSGPYTQLALKALKAFEAAKKGGDVL